MEGSDRIFEILKKKKINQKDFALMIGQTEDTVSNWKRGKSKSYTKHLQEIANALGVSQAELLGEAEPVQADELTEYLDELRSRPEMRMLFHITKGATKEQIEAIVHMIEGFEQK